MSDENKTSNFKDGQGGKRRPGSIVADSMDVAEKAALTTPGVSKWNKEKGTFEGGAAPGEGTIAYDPTVEKAREEREDA